jgi:hypothetical protein
MNRNKKSKFNIGSENYQCNLHYRSYDIDAFDELKGNSLNEVVIATYTSAGSLQTVFNKIENTFKAAKKVTLVLGFHHPRDETKEFKKELQYSLVAIRTQLQKTFWQDVDLKFTLHNHCHIKYIQAGPFCFAGSQNFTGTITGAAVNTNYPKNELIISVLESPAQLQQISKELLLCLHHESDEFVQVSQPDIFDDPDFPQNTYAKLRQARASLKSRQPHTCIYRLLEHEAYADVLREFEEIKVHDRDQKEQEVPKLLSFYQQITGCFAESKYPAVNEEELKLETMNQTLDAIESYVMVSPVSEAIETIINEYQPEDFSGRIQIAGLNPASNTDTMFDIQLRQTIQELENTFNHEQLLQLKIELYETALESLADTLNEFGLEDEQSFRSYYADELFDYIVNNEGSAADYVENSRICPDSLTDYASQYVCEDLPNNKLLQYIGDSKECWIRHQIEDAMKEHADIISCG